MGFWATFWGGLLLIGLVGFAVLSVVVTLGGVREIRALFQGIEAQHEDEDDERRPAGPNLPGGRVSRGV